MKRVLIILSLLLIFSCSEKESDLIVIGSIKGLKKGTLYLQKLKDTALVTLDSLEIVGELPFELHSNLEEPEVLYLTLDKNSTNTHRISFFANKGITEINTTLKRFTYDAKINGSVQQERFDEYNKIISKFNNQRLELIKSLFETQQSENDSLIEAANLDTNKLIRRKYLYTVNFALNNKDSEVAPYVALAEIYDANIKYLDTIYNSLPKDIANSKYGKALNEHITKRKKEESN
jgi:succinate dehydrogenase flavin-adding protein (antitoxin of CptAB toxin-antitoxin module)